MRARAIAALLLLVTSGAACGIGWVDGASGSDGLPTAGIGPYRRLEADPSTPAIEPWLIVDPDADLSSPSVLARAGGGLRVWFTRTEPGAPSQIWYAEVPSVTATPDLVPTPTLLAELPWEGGQVAAPSVVADGDRLIMLYQAGTDQPVIGRAISDDDGATWQRDPTGVLPAGLAPAALVTGEGLVIVSGRAELPGL